jgi:hypothetical protein
MALDFNIIVNHLKVTKLWVGKIDIADVFIIEKKKQNKTLYVKTI